MVIQDTLTRASETLQKHGVPYALIGGFALAAHGVVRATVDIDLLIDGRERERAIFGLTDVGFKVVFESSEVIHMTGYGQLDLLVANRPLSLAMLSRAVPVNGFPVPVLAVEDIIGLKIQAYCNDADRCLRDQADIQSLLRKFNDLDFEQIQIYADLFGEWPTIQKLRGRN